MEGSEDPGVLPGWASRLATLLVTRRPVPPEIDATLRMAFPGAEEIWFVLENGYPGMVEAVRILRGPCSSSVFGAELPLLRLGSTVKTAMLEALLSGKPVVLDASDPARARTYLEWQRLSAAFDPGWAIVCPLSPEARGTAAWLGAAHERPPSPAGDANALPTGEPLSPGAGAGRPVRGTEEPSTGGDVPPAMSPEPSDLCAPRVSGVVLVCGRAGSIRPDLAWLQSWSDEMSWRIAHASTQYVERWLRRVRRHARYLGQPPGHGWPRMSDGAPAYGADRPGPAAAGPSAPAPRRERSSAVPASAPSGRATAAAAFGAAAAAVAAGEALNPQPSDDLVSDDWPTSGTVSPSLTPSSMVGGPAGLVPQAWLAVAATALAPTPPQPLAPPPDSRDPPPMTTPFSEASLQAKGDKACEPAAGPGTAYAAAPPALEPAPVDPAPSFAPRPSSAPPHSARPGPSAAPPRSARADPAAAGPSRAPPLLIPDALSMSSRDAAFPPVASESARYARASGRATSRSRSAASEAALRASLDVPGFEDIVSDARAALLRSRPSFSVSCAASPASSFSSLAAASDLLDSRGPSPRARQMARGVRTRAGPPPGPDAWLPDHLSPLRAVPSHLSPFAAPLAAPSPFAAPTGPADAYAGLPNPAGPYGMPAGSAGPYAAPPPPAGGRDEARGLGAGRRDPPPYPVVSGRLSSRRFQGLQPLHEDLPLAEQGPMWPARDAGDAPGGPGPYLFAGGGTPYRPPASLPVDQFARPTSIYQLPDGSSILHVPASAPNLPLPGSASGGSSLGRQGAVPGSVPVPASRVWAGPSAAAEDDSTLSSSSQESTPTSDGYTSTAADESDSSDVALLHSSTPVAAVAEVVTGRLCSSSGTHRRRGRGDGAERDRGDSGRRRSGARAHDGASDAGLSSAGLSSAGISSAEAQSQGATAVPGSTAPAPDAPPGGGGGGVSRGTGPRTAERSSAHSKSLSWRSVARAALLPDLSFDRPEAEAAYQAYVMETELKEAAPWSAFTATLLGEKQAGGPMEGTAAGRSVASSAGPGQSRKGGGSRRGGTVKSRKRLLLRTVKHRLLTAVLPITLAVLFGTLAVLTGDRKAAAAAVGLAALAAPGIAGALSPDLQPKAPAAAARICSVSAAAVVNPSGGLLLPVMILVGRLLLPQHFELELTIVVLSILCSVTCEVVAPDIETQPLAILVGGSLIVALGYRAEAAKRRAFLAMARGKARLASSRNEAHRGDSKAHRQAKASRAAPRPGGEEERGRRDTDEAWVPLSPAPLADMARPSPSSNASADGARVHPDPSADGARVHPCPDPSADGARVHPCPDPSADGARVHPCPDPSADGARVHPCPDPSADGARVHPCPDPSADGARVHPCPDPSTDGAPPTLSSNASADGVRAQLGAA